MTTIVISTSNVADFPEGGGNFWVYMQYAQGFKELGCDVYWLENFTGENDTAKDRLLLKKFTELMRKFDFEDKTIIHSRYSKDLFPDLTNAVTLSGIKAEALFKRADLLVNFDYQLPKSILCKFKKTALIDIDPGLLQFWITHKQVIIENHDLYFSTGETVGKKNARFPDCGIKWHSIRPVVHLKTWPNTYRVNSGALTTISGWWGGGEEGEWISNGSDIKYENNKRVTFLQFIDLPSRTTQKLELALCLGHGDEIDTKLKNQSQSAAESNLTDYISDAVDKSKLEANGWIVSQASNVAGSPAQYQRYIQSSRGEFSCAKPSCMRFENAWVSDRSICYLASGKPVIVQHTGKSSFLPNENGMFRFVTIDDALSAIESMNSSYKYHCEAARHLAETYFCTQKVLTRVLNTAFRSTDSPVREVTEYAEI